MANQDTQLQAIAVQPEPSHEGTGGLMDFSLPVTLLTWATFLIMTFVLYKLAWKPILNALAHRESTIRRSLEEAEKARAETAAMEERCRSLLAEAEQESAHIVADARDSARQAMERMEAAAAQESRALLDQARKEIESATERARVQLRDETADLAVAVASKILGRQVDASANAELVRQLVKEI